MSEPFGVEGLRSSETPGTGCRHQRRGAVTFADKRPPPGCRVRVRVGSSGYARAGVAQPDGRWDPVYNVPLIPLPEGSWEALRPPRINAFTFFWTEPPRSPGHPGHWERERQGGHVFMIAGGERGGIRTGADRGGSRG